MDYIIAIAEDQNITKAADKLFITRSALNHYLINLENELGMPLFKRLHNKLIPTQAGEIYIKAAREIMLIGVQAEKSLLDLYDCTQGTLNFGITRGRGAEVFGMVYPQFIERYPNFSINLREGNVLELDQLLLNGQIDLAWSGIGINVSPLEHIILDTSEVLLAIPRKHRLAYLEQESKEQSFAQIDLRLLKGEKFALMKPESRIREITDYFFQKAGFEPQIMFESSTIDLLHDLVKKGACLTFVPKSIVASHSDALYFSIQPEVKFKQSISFRKGTYFSEAELYLVELLKEQLVK
ncbi:MAG: LysR substrate-binding domain-containing protein [Oscillospiraceae bacterium]